VFLVNEHYTNRKGNYKVTAITGDKMTVRYEDGTTATLRIEIQARIWENILAEREAAAARARHRTSIPGSNHYIKTISLDEEDLAIPGLRQRLAAAGVATELNPGDRLIYFAVEPMVFFAVATITAPPRQAPAKDYRFGAEPDSEINLYPIDVDAHLLTIEASIGVDSAELESIVNPRVTLRTPDLYIPISEDDFEVLAELMIEIDAEDDDLDDDDLDDSDDDLFDLD
jgi:hypothetical protein